MEWRVKMRLRKLFGCIVVTLLCGMAYAAAPTLAHRWSFSGDYIDSVGGTSATVIGSSVSFNDSNSAVVMYGDGNGAGSLNLGTDMLPPDADELTLELWVTHNAVKNWARVLDYGSDNQNYLTLTWCEGTDATKERVEIKKANTSILACDCTLTTYAIDMPYHLSVTFKVNSNGSTFMRWMRRNASTGALEHVGAIDLPDWRLANIVAPKFYLGHSQYTPDLDANATYDEVRVWRGVLTDEQLTASVLAGPDVLPDVGSTAAFARTVWTGAVDDDATNAGNWNPVLPNASTLAVFAGDFAAQIPAGSSFACAGVVFEDARLAADCDWRGLAAKINAGALDLAGHKLYVSQLDGSGTITGASLIPAEYQTIEYIQSSGGQWVNTGFTPSCMDRIEMKVNFANVSGTQCLYCSRATSTTVNTMTSFLISGKFRFDRNTNISGGNVFAPVADTDYTVSVDFSSLACKVNGTDAGTMAGAGSFTPGSPIALFASHTSGTGLNKDSVMDNWASYKLYSFKVLDRNGALKCHFVPVRRVADGELGLYDRVSGGFVTNNTSTPLTGGADVVDATSGSECELHVDVPSGASSVNSGVEITGCVKVFKEGEGSFANKAVMYNTGVGGFVAGTLDIGANKFRIKGRDGVGTVTAQGGNLLKNGDFQADVVESGAYGRLAPQEWAASGTLHVLLDNHDYADEQANGSNWTFLEGSSTISQTFFLSADTQCAVSMNIATWNNRTNYAKTNGNVQIDGSTVFSWTDLGWRTTALKGNVELKAGLHTIRIACTTSTADRGLLVDNVSVTAAGVLDVNVPEGETSENLNVEITGGAGMRVQKTGKGKLIMTKANTGFGAGGRRSGNVSMFVKEGVVRKVPSEGVASCGAQYSTIVVEEGGQFDVAGRTYWDYDYVLAGNGPDGKGALVNTDTVSSPREAVGNRGYFQDLALAGDATIGGSEPWAMLFYGYEATSMNMNGHRLTYAGTTFNAGNMSYSGTGRIVVAEDATLEFWHNSPSAPDCEIEVNGVFAQDGAGPATVGSLLFAETGRYSSTEAAPPAITVRTAYAPPTAVVDGSSAAKPMVTLGADGHINTTLDLSRLVDAFDATTTTFFSGSEVTVDIGERTFVEDTLLASWNAKPQIQGFVGKGAAIEAKQVAVAAREDGLWAVKLLPDRPFIARWIGGGEEGNYLDPANWSCWNASGDPIYNTVPGDITTVVVDGPTTLSVPEGAVTPWARIKFGAEQKATKWGRIFYGADRYSNSTYPDTSYINIKLGEYVSYGNGSLVNLDGQNTAWQYSWLDWSQLRFDGWFYIAPSQAGSWHITQSFDDYFGFAVDGEWVVLNRTYTAKTETDCEMTEGWHRFTIVCGDTWGGQGSRDVSVNGTKTPMAISINGGAEIAFSAANFTFGSGENTITLNADCDWRSLGSILLRSGATIDLNGHVLKTVGVVCDDHVGATVMNSAAATGELLIEVPEGATFSLDGVSVKGNVRVAKAGGGTLVMATAGSDFKGGIVIEEGMVKPAWIGPKFPIGTINLLENWNFDESTIGNNSGNWSYANGGNYFDMPGWTSSNFARIGLSKASGTWVTSGRGVGKYALFMQTVNGSGTADASQDVEVKTPGTYHYYFQYAGRPKYIGATTELRLIHNGVSKTIASVTTSADTYSTCEGFVEIDKAGTYTLQFCQLATSSDKANTIDNVVFSCCNPNSECVVKVNEGATFEVDGQYDFWYNAFTLAGGTFQNSGSARGSGTAQIKYMFLTADSTMRVGNSYGFVGNGYSRAVLDLGGNTLTVLDLEKTGGNFYLYNALVKNGVLNVVEGGWLETGNAGVTATDAKIMSSAAMCVNGAVEIRDYTAYRESSKHNDGTAAFKVYGAFTPATDVFYGCQMQDGSTIDLSGRTGAWHTTMSIDDNAKGSTTVTFADDATITVKLYGRSDLYRLIRSDNPFVVTWNEEPANIAGLKFVTDDKSRKMGLRLVPDTKMVPGDDGPVAQKGLRLVYLGGSALFFR